jgi:hypothetical protein
MNKLEIQILSVPHKEKLIAEIQNGDYIIAEISNDKERFEIELFSYDDHRMEISLDEFINTINEARKELLGGSVN